MDATADRAEKLARLDRVLEEADLAAVWLAHADDFGWLLGGDNLVNHRNPDGVAAVGYDGDGLTVLTTNIEAPRLREEEVPVDVTVEAFPWHDSSLEAEIAARTDGPYGADVPLANAAELDPTTFRMPLTSRDVERSRALGRDVAAGLEAACLTADPTDAERDVAAMTAAELRRRGIQAPVALVGGERRAPVHRHFTPTDEPIGGYALVSVSATRGGLWVSATRTIAFDPPEWLAERTERAQQVDAAVIRATETASTAGEAFAAIQDAYAAVGEPDEWREHHQGGASGYAGREWIATPDHPGTVHRPQTYAWNPTIRGAKSEDTVLVTDDGVELLTTTGEWPTVGVEPAGGGEPLDRHDVLVQE